MTYESKKEEIRARYLSLHGRKLIPCIACAGSGRYDHNGSQKCGACGGAGKELESIQSRDAQYKVTP